MKKILLIVLALVVNSVMSFAGSVELSREISRVYHDKHKPFFIISLSSDDCANCRAYIADLLKSYQGIDKSYVELLIDDNNMKGYLAEYPEVYREYHVTLDRPLAKQISFDSKSKLVIVNADTIMEYDVSEMTQIRSSINHTLQQGFNLTDGGLVAPRVKMMRDTIMGSDVHYETSSRVELLFNERFQLVETRFHDSTKTFKFGVSENLYSRALKSIKQVHPANYLSYKDAKALLRMITIPQITVNSMRINNDNLYLFYKINVVSQEKPNAKGETDTAVQMYYFLAKLRLDEKGINKLEHLEDYDQTFALDSTHYKGEVYIPQLGIDFEAEEDVVLMPLINMDNEFRQSKPSDTTLLVGAYKVLNSELKLTKIYKSNLAKDYAVLIRMDEKKNPIVWSPLEQTFLNLAENKSIPFPKMFGDQRLGQIHDFRVVKNSLCLIGNTASSTIIMQSKTHSTDAKYWTFFGGIKMNSAKFSEDKIKSLTLKNSQLDFYSLAFTDK